MKRFWIFLSTLAALICLSLIYPAAAAPTLPEQCEHCKTAVTWQPLTEADSETDILPGGHYYLDFEGDNCTWAEKSVPQKTCLYLNGKTLRGAARAFYITGELSILGEGTVTAPGPSSKASGGTIEVYKTGTLNLYGGTLTSHTREDGVTYTVNGGCVNSQGIFRMYGGTIRDGLANNVGSNVFITIHGQFFSYGGTVEGDGHRYHSVVTRGKVELAGDANLNMIWLFPNVEDGGPSLRDMLTVQPTYSGTAGAYYSSATEGLIIGSAKAEFPGTLTIKERQLTIYHGQLLLWFDSPVMILGENPTPCATLQEALQEATDTIVLMKDVAETITSDTGAFLDLNGHSLTGNITGNLLCMDSATDDYTVADGIYGTATPSEGLKARDGYLMLEKDGLVSFHRLNLEITGMALRTEAAGMYFTAAFSGDEMIKDRVQTFGLAASVEGDPVQYPESSVRTALDSDRFGTGIENTSTLIRDIIKPENRQLVNELNSKIPIYGRAYVQLTDGTYHYGGCQSRSLQQQMEYIDKMWSATTTAQQSKLVEFYKNHRELMASWDIPKLRLVTENVGNAASPLEALQTLEARRNEVEQYMRHQVTVLWQVNEPVTYSFKSNSGDPELDADNYINTFEPGEIFSGLPYTHGSGNAETFVFLAPPDEKGVHTFQSLDPALIGGGGGYTVNSTARLGNNCADSVFSAWGRVSSSVNFRNSFNMTPYYGCIPVGDYETVDPAAVRYSTATTDITTANGESVMYRAYSQLQKGDAMTLTIESGAGHALLVSEVHVVLKNGQIDGANSYILYHDQSSKYYNKGLTRYDETLGQTVRVVGGCDSKYTFAQLYSKGLLPVTCKELIDPTPLEEEWVQDSVPARTANTFFDGTVTSNYRIAAVTVGISDALGNPLQQCTRFVPESEMHSCNMARFSDPIEQPVRQGELDLGSLPPGSYSYVISCRLFTGRELTVSEGVFQIP